jgi:phytoene dehydrogenase-like protein
MATISVVGAGLAGLNAARYLAIDDHDVRVLERDSDVGGRVRTRTVDGYTLDRGFQVLFTSYPAVRRDLDLEALNLRTFTPGATLARPGRRSVYTDPLRDPGGALGTISNPEVPLRDGLRLLRLRADLYRRGPSSFLPGPRESIEEYLRRRGFSESFLEHFARPFYGGITLDRSLSTAAGIFEYTFAMLSSGRIAVPAEGMAAIPDQLAQGARAAGAQIDTDVEVVDVEAASDDSGATVRTESGSIAADAIVVATDPATASDLTAIDGIPTAAKGCTTQYFAVEGDRGFANATRLVLNVAGQTPNHVAPLSGVAPDYAPADRQLLSATTLGITDRTDEELAEETTSTIASWYPEVSVDALSLLETDRIPFAQYAQPPGFQDGLPEPTAPDGPVVLAGDYTRWSSIQGALESGHQAANLVNEIATGGTTATPTTN